MASARPRLRDIDAPEICQPWGPEAKAALSEPALNKLAILTPSSRDSYGHVVGRITVEELDIGRRLVEEGHAWSTRTRCDRGPLVKHERMAKAPGRGLHPQLPRAVPPWEWRRDKGPCPKP
jgi:micrococcal nuclease